MSQTLSQIITLIIWVCVLIGSIFAIIFLRFGKGTLTDIILYLAWLLLVISSIFILLSIIILIIYVTTLSAITSDAKTVKGGPGPPIEARKRQPKRIRIPIKTTSPPSYQADSAESKPDVNSPARHVT